MLETSPIILIFVPKKWAYNSFQVAYYSCIPSFYIPQVPYLHYACIEHITLIENHAITCP